MPDAYDIYLCHEKVVAAAIKFAEDTARDHGQFIAALLELHLERLAIDVTDFKILLRVMRFDEERNEEIYQRASQAYPHLEENFVRQPETEVAK
jgi:hypothetical protein